MDKDSLEKLKSRMEYLEKMNSWYFIALQRLASLGDLHKDFKLYRDPNFLFVTARKFLKQLLEFQTLAFYLADEAAWQTAVQRMFDAGNQAVSSHNPYWDVRGVTFEDADGYRVVLQHASWEN